MESTRACLESLDKRGIEGDVVECGVWKGGHLILTRLVSPNRICLAYDTFDGMTPPGPHDKRRRGFHASDSYNAKKASGRKWMAVSLEEVQENFRTEGVLDYSMIRFVVGDVAESLLKIVPGKIALLRLDTDWYESTKIELEVLYPRLVPGGILIVDDYGHWMGSKMATNKYFEANGMNTDDLEWVDYSTVIWRKQ